MWISTDYVEHKKNNAMALLWNPGKTLGRSSFKTYQQISAPWSFLQNQDFLEWAVTLIRLG